MDATAAACQGIWLRNRLGTIADEVMGPVTLYIDNKSAINLAKNPIFHMLVLNILIFVFILLENVLRSSKGCVRFWE